MSDHLNQLSFTDEDETGNDPFTNEPVTTQAT